MDLTEAIFPEHHPKLTRFKVRDYENIYSQTDHRAHKNELLYVLDGQVTLHIGKDLRFDAEPGDFLLIPAGTLHRDEFVPIKGLRILCIFFDWEEKDYFRQVNNLTMLNLSYETRNEARRRLEYLRDHFQETELGKRNASLQLFSILMLFYFDIRDNAPETEKIVSNQPAAEIMRQVKHYLDRNFSSPVTLKDAAAFAGISPSHLSRSFHREYGVGFSAYLTALRLEAAHHLLQTTSLQIGEIADRCGFSSSSYFIWVYTRRWGVTPKNHVPRKRDATAKRQPGRK